MSRRESRERIVVVQNMAFYPYQIERLKSLGDGKFYEDSPRSPEEWLKRCEGADIVCSGKFGLDQKIYQVKNTFFSLPFVGIGWLDKQKLKESNITVSYCPGCNKDAVSEWIVGMILNLLRQFPTFINASSLSREVTAKGTLGLSGKRVCILGKGNIGGRAGDICAAFDMKVTYFRRGDDLIQVIKDADIVVDCLSANSTTTGLLDRKFFNSLKKGSYFITATDPKICDIEALLEALDKGILTGAAHDTAGLQTGDIDNPFYQRLLNHPKVLVTPHIAYYTDVTVKFRNDMMIDNVEAWLKGKPINILE
ncbi:MAG: NAD(P)-dependent oxidoreductase [Candidatus Binatia bacterium]